MMAEARDFETQLTAMMKEAMKRGDKPRLMALRAVKSVLTTERTKTGKPLTEEQAIAAIGSYRKKMAGALDQYRDAGRDELAVQAEGEIALCDELLPEQMDESEIEALVVKKIEEVGASSMADLGKVMGPIMKDLKGKADGNVVRKIVTAQLGG
jgi:uncharacterized protein YqeY